MILSLRGRRVLVASFRLGVLAAALVCMHRSAEEHAPSDADLLPLAQSIHANARRFGEPRDGLVPVLDDQSQVLGWLGTTTEQAGQWVGYNGPSEAVVFFDLQQRVQAVRLRRSADTAGHVAKVEADDSFWQQWLGKNTQELSSYTPERLVSGASLTSEAIASGIAQRFGAIPAPSAAAAAELRASDVNALFPQATHWRLTNRAGCWTVFHHDQSIGMLLSSSQMGIAVRGYNGASDVEVALDPAGKKVIGVRLVASRDNAPYWQDVAQEWSFYAPGQQVVDVIAALRCGEPVPVSGASITNAAVEETLIAMLMQWTRPAPAWWQSVSMKSALAIVWLAVAVFIACRSRLGPRRRRVWAGVCIVAGLFWGWMLGQDQLLAWAKQGGVRGVATPLLVMTVVALLLPALLGKNVYCSHICPHGAAQSLLGSWQTRRFVLSARWQSRLRAVPWLTLMGIWFVAAWGHAVSVAQAEPFEIWSAGFYAWIPASLFTLGLIGSWFIPKFYCHYGCPTGALLRWLAHSPSHFTRRDYVALGLVVMAWAASWFR